MEFWGVEVKSGEPLKVQPEKGQIVHLSQANIGEIKKDKGSETICLFVNIDGKKMVIGTLFSDKLPQQQFDLVFDREFELSHNWKAGSIFFIGYKADNQEEEDVEGESDTDSEEEDMPLVANNGKLETKDKQEKPAGVEKANAGKDAASGKQKVKIVEPSKVKEDDEDSDDDSDEDASSDDDMAEDESDSEGGDDSDSDEDDDSAEEEETPKKVETGKKRAAESSSKTPVPDKKAKLTTPQKTDGKKGGVHVATPHPSKKTVAKTPATTKSNQPATPKSAGSHACSSCKKTFNSENALQSHSKAKHSAGK